MKKLILFALVIILMTITGCAGKKENLQYKGVNIYCQDITYNLRYSTSGWTVIGAKFGKLDILPKHAGIELLSPEVSDSLYCIRVINSGEVNQWYLFPINPRSMKVLNIATFLANNRNIHTSPTESRNMKDFYIQNATKVQYILDTVNECPEITENNISIVWGTP